MRLGTAYVLPDEPCYYLEEKNHHGHRIQRVTVVRNDKLADWTKDLGESKSFMAPEVQFIGGFQDGGKLFIEETVGTLQGMADDFRNRDFSNETVVLPDLLDGYARLKEVVPNNHS